MQSTSSQGTLLELSEDLQNKINDLTFANYRCEKILRYLKLCQIENADLSLSEPPSIDSLQKLDESCSITVPSQSDGKYEPTSLPRGDESTSTSLSLEDVLNLARETRERGTRIKFATNVGNGNLNGNIDNKLNRYPFLISLNSKPRLS